MDRVQTVRRFIMPPGHRESESESVGEEVLIHIHAGKTAPSTRLVADKSVASNLCLIPQGRGVMQKYQGLTGPKLSGSEAIC